MVVEWVDRVNGDVHGALHGFDAVIYVQPLTDRPTGAPHSHFRVSGQLGCDDLLHQSPEGMRPDFIEVVFRAVHIGDDEVDCFRVIDVLVANYALAPPKVRATLVRPSDCADFKPA